MKNKLKVLKPKLTAELSKYIQESYYLSNDSVKATTEREYRTTKQMVRTSGKQEVIIKGTTYVSMERDVQNSVSAKKHFVNITYPQVAIIPEPMVKKLGVREMTYKTHKGKPNCIRYYTDNKKLTDKQCSVLYIDDDIRSTYGFEINDKPMTNEMLVSYVTYVDKLGKIAVLKSNYILKENEIKRNEITRSLDRKLRTMDTLFKEMSPALKPNKDGSRKPMVIQLGVNSYMKRNKITNPVEIIDVHAKGEKIKVYDFKNLNSLLQEINVNPQEAFDYVTKYLNKNVNIKRIHTQDREEERGGTALRNLVEFYYAELERTTKLKKTVRKTKLFTYPMLMASDEWKDYCKATKQPAVWSYDKFKKWFVKKLDVIQKIK